MSEAAPPPSGQDRGSAPESGGPPSHSLLVRWTIFRPVTVLMVALAFLVLGVLSYPRIPLQLVPDGLSSGNANIYIPVPDSTPREVMEEVVKPTEDYLRTISGMKRIISSSGARRANIRLEFSPDRDADSMAAEIRDRLERAKALWPPGVDRYNLWRHQDNDMPVYIAAMSMDVDESRVDVDHLFDEVIKKRLVAIDGVARVNIWGLLDKRVEIGLDPSRVEAHGIELQDLIQRLSSDNRTINAGSIRQGDQEFLVRVDGKFRDFQEVLDYPANDGFHISDFAEVGYGAQVRDRMSRVNGFRSRVVTISKESSANAVAVCDRVERAMREIEATLRRTMPGLGRIESHSWMNQGEQIRYSIASLKESGLWGAFFAVVVLYLFFRKAGMTLLVTLSIPFSFIITIVWMFFRGQTFNVLSLMGLTLGVGMLVDNAIVVVENFLRKREEGHSVRESAILGVEEVGLAITLATLTTVIVFLPGVFIENPMIRGYFSELGEPMSVSVLASLLVALVFIPQGGIFLQNLQARWGERWRIFRRRRLPSPGNAVQYSATNRAFRRGLEWCLDHRMEALLITCGLFAFSQFLYRNIRKSDLPPGGPRRLEIDLKLPPNFTLSEADQAFAAVEKVILDRKEEFQIKSVTSWFNPTGGEVNIFPITGARLKEEEFFAKLRPLLPRLPGVKYKMGFEDFARDEGGQRLRVFLHGNDLNRLEELGAMVESELQDRSRFPELEEVTPWKQDESEEVRIAVTRRLAQEYDTNTALISRMVSWALRGAVLPDFQFEDRELPFWIRNQGGYKENVEELNGVRVFRPAGEPVRLENLARYSMVPGSGEIHRTNGKITVGYSARVVGDFQTVKEKVERYFSRFPLPDGFEINLRQEARGFQQDLKNLLFALSLALALVFLLMGVLFESFLLPLSILFSIPHAFFGSLFLLWAMGVTLDVVGMIGFLMLVGIVVNNAIVLVDCVNRLRAEGIERRQAMAQGMQIRFRPIWMTALTTIFGLLPLLLFPQSGEGVDYKPLAVVLAGGLTTSTFFTLFVVPLFYTFLDDLHHAAIRFLRLDRAGLLRLAGLGRGETPAADCRP